MTHSIVKASKKLIAVLSFATLVLPSLCLAENADIEAPDFTLKSNQDANIRLTEQRGNVVMLNFWASWCGPCRQEMPHLNALSEQYSDLGFNLYGINVDEDLNDAKRAISDLAVAFPVLFDNENAVADLFRVDAMPTTIIIDRDGNIRQLHRGYESGYEKMYEKEVASLIRE